MEKEFESVVEWLEAFGVYMLRVVGIRPVSFFALILYSHCAVMRIVRYLHVVIIRNNSIFALRRCWPLSSAEVSVLSKKAGNLCQKSRPIVQNTGGGGGVCEKFVNCYCYM
jgi:hypothetical protein